MARYSHLLGWRVTVQYRAGDILVPASGTFVADSGRSIFLEQHIEQRGKRSYFRWEIPYGISHRIEEVSEPEQPAAADFGARASRTPGRGGWCRTWASGHAFDPAITATPQNRLNCRAFLHCVGESATILWHSCAVWTNPLCARRDFVSNSSTPRRIGLIGLGLMGRPMGMNLLKAGHNVDGVESHGLARPGIGGGGREAGQDAARGSGRSGDSVDDRQRSAGAGGGAVGPRREKRRRAWRVASRAASTSIRARSPRRWCGRLPLPARSDRCAFWMRR